MISSLKLKEIQFGLKHLLHSTLNPYNAYNKYLQKKKRVYVLGDISSMAIHIQESAMDLKEVQYLLFNGYE